MDTFDWVMNGTGPRHDAASFVIVVVACIVAVIVFNLIGRSILLKIDEWAGETQSNPPLFGANYIVAGCVFFMVTVIPLLGIANGLWALIFDRWLF